MRLLLILMVFYTALFSTRLDEQLRSTVQNNPDALSNYVSEQTIIRSLYRKNNYRPLWVGHAKNLNTLRQALEDSYFNYKDKDFYRSQINRYVYLLNNHMNLNQNSNELSKLDIFLTRAYVSLTHFIVKSDINWDRVQTKMERLKEEKDITASWEMVHKSVPSASRLFSAIVSQDLNGFFHSLTPLKKRHQELVNSLKFYKSLGLLPRIKYGKDLRLGDRYPYITDIKKRLIITGDLRNRRNTSDLFDNDLKQAIYSYKERFNLKHNGLIDKILVYYLNKETPLLVQQIITNLDKLKVFPNSFPNEYIRVNIPSFKMDYIKYGHSILTMRAVVGRPERPTPIFSSYMTYLELNPYWNIPENLVRRDLIVALQEHPDYLKEHNIRVFNGWKKKGEMKNFKPEMLFPYADKSRGHIPYRFVQYPGDDNALGRVKFMFPNKYSVYLHDTDNKDLFQYTYRVYSSGCMRLERPFELLEVLKSRMYSKDIAQIDRYRRTLKNKVIRFKRKLPVHTTYFTVYRENGLTYFRKDIYEYDRFIEESQIRNY